MAQLTLLPESLQLDRYQLLGEIASGGMASVFLARLAGVGGFQRLVAIKRLHPHLAKEREFVDMFLDEARLAASIHHKNVVPILEIGQSQQGYYLVMEYIEGVTLARLMTQASALREAVPRPVLLRIIIDALSGLHAAHELNDDAGRPLGVVHRDCSPQNMLVGIDGCSRITDFGIARATARLSNTREGAMKGKLAYMAPEQTQGDEFDRRADLFSLAVVLWEVLTQRRLFKAKTEAQTLKRLLHDPIPRVTDLVPDVSPALASVCAMALEREPGQRFQTAAQMADAIESAARVAAREAEPIATERTVEAFMKARYAGDVSAQREELRTWLQATPTMLGERRPTDPGWVPNGSGPPSDRGEPAPVVPEPLRASSSNHPLLTTVVLGDGESQTELRPISGDDVTQAGQSADEATAIYDPVSIAGELVRSEPMLLQPSWVPTPPHMPSTQQVAAVDLPPPRRGTALWGVLFAVGAAAAVAALLWFRFGRSEPETRAPVSEVAAARNEEDVEKPAAVAPAAPAASSAASAATTAQVAPPRYAPRGPAPSAAPVAPAEPQPPAPVPEPAKPPEPKKGGDLDDLSNPYR